MRQVPPGSKLDQQMTEYEDENKALIQADQINLCKKYLMWQMSTRTDENGKQKRVNHSWIAQQFGVCPDTLTAWVKRWKEGGIYATAQKEVYRSVADDVQLTMSRAVQQFTDILDIQIQDALSNESPSNRLKAAKFVHDVIKPELQHLTDYDRDDQDWTPSKKKQVYDPLKFVGTLTVNVQPDQTATSEEKPEEDVIDGEFTELPDADNYSTELPT